ncbi:MAG: HAD domain-containing protein [Clostridiaceae bacterium]
MKVVFLDINGVLFLNGDEVNPESITFDKRSMENLKKIMDLTSSSIVLSSTWRTSYKSESNIFWKSILCNFTKYNLEEKIIGITPTIVNDFEEVSRGIEISEWLNTNSPIDNYIILDDDEISDIDKNKFIQCDPFTGIDDYVSNKAIKILNS